MKLNLKLNLNLNLGKILDYAMNITWIVLMICSLITAQYGLTAVSVLFILSNILKNDKTIAKLCIFSALVILTVQFYKENEPFWVCLTLICFVMTTLSGYMDYKNKNKNSENSQPK